MSPATKTASAPANPGPMKDRGIKIHNLVFVRDSGLDYAEFRVQCEIRMPRPRDDNQVHPPEDIDKAQTDADRVAMLLKDVKAAGALEELEEIVTPYIYGPASELFKQTVKNAFADQKKYLQRKG